jgi:hypothetical protein
VALRHAANPRRDASLLRPDGCSGYKGAWAPGDVPFLTPSSNPIHHCPVDMPKLFIDQHGIDDAQYAFMDSAGNRQFTSTSSVDLIDGTTSTDIYEHTGMISQGHLAATIKWSSNNFRDPMLILYPDVDSGDTGHTTKLPLSTNHIKQ